jgi:hypothetical protein
LEIKHSGRGSSFHFSSAWSNCGKYWQKLQVSFRMAAVYAYCGAVLPMAQLFEHFWSSGIQAIMYWRLPGSIPTSLFTIMQFYRILFPLQSLPVKLIPTLLNRKKHTIIIQ